MHRVSGLGQLGQKRSKVVHVHKNMRKKKARERAVYYKRAGENAGRINERKGNDLLKQR